MTFPGHGYVAYAIQLRPLVGSRIVAPYVVEPLESIGAAKEIHLVSVGDYRVVGSRRRYLALVGTRIVTVRYQKLPFVLWHLQLVEIESGQIVHEVALDLSTENVDLGPENVQRVAVATGRPRSGR
jgi:hypothetical protein